MTVKSSHSGQRSHTMASSSDQPVTEAAGSSSDSQDQAVSEGQGLGEEKKERVRRRMLERLSGTAAHFAHQQRDAPDLSQQEKVDIAAEILHRNPATFLARLVCCLMFWGLWKCIYTYVHTCLSLSVCSCSWYYFHINLILCESWIVADCC